LLWLKNADNRSPVTPAEKKQLHDWREEALRLREQLIELQAELDALKRHVYGKRSEKMPVLLKAHRRTRSKEVNAAEAKKKRQDNALQKKLLEEKTVEHKIPDEKRACTVCDGKEFKALGEGKTSSVLEYVAPRFIRHVHVQETLICLGCKNIMTAEAPEKVIDKGGYGASFIAHLIVQKCADAIPLYRLSKQFKRQDVIISPSTLGDLYHSAADLLRPLADRVMALIALDERVQADETPLQVQEKNKTRRAYVWAFLSLSLAARLIAYRYSAGRSGETPKAVLGKTTGTLVVDGYSGYNVVCEVEGRQRAGCLAHARRKFFDALKTAPIEAQAALDQIRDVYRVEHIAHEKGIAGSAEHLALRKSDSLPLMNKIKTWLDAQKTLHLPKGPMGQAVSYALNQWDSLTVFLSDARLPIDNNHSENALRAVALGRKNFLFVGNDQAGENLAVLYTLVATCIANDVNPETYFTDVLLRVKSHPAARIDELLPHNWNKPAFNGSATISPDSDALSAA
jgi:transposase